MRINPRDIATDEMERSTLIAALEAFVKVERKRRASMSLSTPASRMIANAKDMHIARAEDLIQRLKEA